MQPIYIACPDPIHSNHLAPFTTPYKWRVGGLGVQWWGTTGLPLGFDFTL